MKYIDMKRALLSNHTVGMYKPNARLIQMVTILACHDIVSIVTNGIDWRVTLLRKPVVTVADVDLKTTLAVMPDKPQYAHIRLADKIRWQDGKRTVTPQWSGKAYPVTGNKDGFVMLDTGYGVIGRKAENLKYAAYVAGVKAAA